MAILNDQIRDCVQFQSKFPDVSIWYVSKMEFDLRFLCFETETSLIAPKSYYPSYLETLSQKQGKPIWRSYDCAEVWTFFLKNVAKYLFDENGPIEDEFSQINESLFIQIRDYGSWKDPECIMEEIVSGEITKETLKDPVRILTNPKFIQSLSGISLNSMVYQTFFSQHSSPSDEVKMLPEALNDVILHNILSFYFGVKTCVLNNEVEDNPSRWAYEIKMALNGKSSAWMEFKTFGKIRVMSAQRHISREGVSVYLFNWAQRKQFAPIAPDQMIPFSEVISISYRNKPIWENPSLKENN